MNIYILLTLMIGVFLISSVLTKWLITSAHKFKLIDKPNFRSSHETPTPSGAGIVFSIATLVGWFFLAYKDQMSYQNFLAITLPALVIIFIGQLDDRLKVSSISRLAGQITAIFLLLFLYKDISVKQEQDYLSLFILGILLVSLINIFNFMDGIDGMAGLYSVTICACILILHTLEGRIFLPPLVLGASLAGFIIYNWSPSSIFMGDSGSTFLGYSTGIFILLSIENIDLWAWIILLAAFLGDAGWTLTIRAATNQKWWNAHRLHVYQKLAPRANQHSRVSLLYSIYTLFWLLPIAYLYLNQALNNLMSLLLAYLPVFSLCMHTRAGKEHSRES